MLKSQIYVKYIFSFVPIFQKLTTENFNIKQKKRMKKYLNYLKIFSYVKTFIFRQKMGAVHP